MDIDPKHKMKLKQMLLSKRAECQKELDILIMRAKKHSRESSIAITNHPADVAVSHNISLSLIPVKEKIISKYIEALKRLQCGEYGICISCKQSILIERLRVIPFTDKCTRCKAETEKGDSVSVNGATIRISKVHRNKEAYILM